MSALAPRQKIKLSRLCPTPVVFVISCGLGWKITAPVAEIFTCLVMAVALSLPMGLALLLENVSQLGGSWQRAAQISLFLELDAGDTYENC